MFLLNYFYKLYRFGLSGKINLNNGLICEVSISNNYYIYEEKSNKQISTIECKEDIISIIGLDNKDILFEEKENIILVYRMKKNAYVLIQIILKTKDNYENQKIVTFYGCTFTNKKDKEYKFFKIEKISRNRFILCSNYGLKFYQLEEENNNYQNIYTYKAWDSTDILLINNIKEIDRNNFEVVTYNMNAATIDSSAHKIKKTYKIQLPINEDYEKEEEGENQN